MRCLLSPLGSRSTTLLALPSGCGSVTPSKAPNSCRTPVTFRSCFCDKQFTWSNYALRGPLSPRSRKDSMSENHIDHHHKAAEHHEHAAKHHRAAAAHHQNGDHEKGAHHAHAAHGHGLHAEHHASEAAKHHANEHGQVEHAHSA